MRTHTLIDNFPHKYYFFGSENSTDTDVMIEVEEIPTNQETSIQYIKQLQKDFDIDWNMNMVVIKDGVIEDVISSKGTKDNANNSLFHTYKLHEQKYECPVYHLVKRNKLLNIYKCIRTILSSLTRTHYRNIVKPLKGIHPFINKLLSMKEIDFLTIETFGNKYQDDASTWKVIAFYLAQSISLLEFDIEIYDKHDLIYYYPLLKPFIMREVLKEKDFIYLNNLLFEYNKILEDFNFENPEEGILILNEEKIDMCKEKALN